MNPKIFTFKHEDFNPIRAFVDTEPWFIGRDLTFAMGYKNLQAPIVSYVREEDRKHADFTLNGKSPWLLNEKGLFDLLNTDVHPKIRKLSDWLKETVLPQLYAERDRLKQLADNTDGQLSLFAAGNGAVRADGNGAGADGAVRADGQELTVSVFDDKDFGEIRYVIVNDEPWFIAADVCRILELGNTSQAVSRLDDDEKNTLILNEGIPGNPTKVFVNEPGLYRLIFASRVPGAKKFQRKVYHEILPSIRKTGSYSVGGVDGVATVPAVDPEQKRLAEAYDYGRILAKLIFAPNSPPTYEIAKIITNKIFE